MSGNDWQSVAATALFLLLALPLLCREHRLKMLGSGLLLAAAVVFQLGSVVWKHNLLANGEFLLLMCCVVRTVCLLLFYSKLTAKFFDDMPLILLDVVYTLGYVAALLIALHRAGASASSLFASSAIVTAVIGYVLKDTLGNIFSGLALQVERPFQKGDWIQFDADMKHIGEVIEVNWRATKVLTLDLVYVIIPNSFLSQASITNFSAPTKCSRRSLYVTAPYSVPPERVRSLILDALHGTPSVLEDPAPSVVTNAFTERGVEYWVRIFTNDFHIRDRVDSEARNRIWYTFHRHGIGIPGTQHDVSAMVQRRQQIEEVADEHRDQRKDLLKNVDFLRNLPDDALDLLALCSKRVLFASNERILRQGDDGSELFVLVSGKVRVSAEGQNGVPVLLSEMAPPQFFGEMSFLTGERRSATVTAAGATECLVIDKDAMSNVLASAPTLAETICDSLAQRQSATSAALAKVRSGNGREQTEDVDLLQRIRTFFGL